MGKAIVVSLALIIIIGIIAFVVRRSLKEANQVGDLDLKQERDLRRMVQKAADVMQRLESTRHNLNEFDVLSDSSREAVDQWLRDYALFIDRIKEINA